MDVFAVSVDPPEASARLKKRLDSELTFLSDPDGSLLDRLGIRHRSGNRGDIAYPTQVLVDGDGIVRWTYVTDDLRIRSDPAAVFGAIDSL